MKNILLFLFVFHSLFVKSQEMLIGGMAHYSYQIPTADIATQYGPNNNVGINLHLKLYNNLTFGVEGQFLFGAKYKDATGLGDMITTGGFIIGQNGSIEIPELEGRGGNFFVEIGKIFTLNTKNKNSGIHIKAGVGYFFYSVYNIVDALNITQLSDNYAAGYNRLESGLSINSFIGYTLYSKNKMINGSFGIHTIYASTKLQGIVDYATGLAPSQIGRSSILIGPKIGIAIVLKRIQKQDPKSDDYFYN